MTERTTKRSLPSLRVVALAVAVVAFAAALVRLTSGDEPEPGPAAAATKGAASTPAAGSRAFVEVESVLIAADKGQAIPAPQASGGHELLMWANGSVRVRLQGPIDRPVLRLRGDQCEGAPRVRVRLNGEKIASQPVDWSDWRTIELAGSSATADNVMSIAFLGDHGTPDCDRNLRLDWVAASPAAADARGTPAKAADPPPTSTPAAKAPRGGEAGGSGLYVDPASAAAQAARSLRGERPREAALLEKIARQPQAFWLGEWSGNVETTARAITQQASAQHQRVVFTTYAIPSRDCGSYSRGGLSADRYRTWIDQLARGIGSAAALVVVEPDAIPQADCLERDARNERFDLLRHAVTRLSALPDTQVYLDAGHTGWKPVSEIAARLQSAGIEQADGFALNVSNYQWTGAETDFGRRIGALVGGKGFVIDTSRNGNGPNDSQWCNPPGRALGRAPTLQTGKKGVDAYLWIKRPGESDGTCNGGPPAGRWWQDGALELARGAG